MKQITKKFGKRTFNSSLLLPVLSMIVQAQYVKANVMGLSKLKHDEAATIWKRDRELICKFLMLNPQEAIR